MQTASLSDESAGIWQIDEGTVTGPNFPPTSRPHTPPCVSSSLSNSEADSRLMAGWPTGHVAHTVLPPHGSTMCHFHLQA